MNFLSIAKKVNTLFATTTGTESAANSTSTNALHDLHREFGEVVYGYCCNELANIHTDHDSVIQHVTDLMNEIQAEKGKINGS